jgi:hypothetical protein
MNTEHLITERYRDQIIGVVSCFDRIVVTGTLPDICHPRAMTSQLSWRDLRIFDYSDFVNPIRNMLHENAKKLAASHGAELEVVRKLKDFRKEDRIKEIVCTRGIQEGLVHVFSAMENCNCFKPWHDRNTGKTLLKASGGRCAHYYFYFLDAILGLLYVRVPTWAPFRLQICLNGHNWLANMLNRSGISYKMNDNAFVDLKDFGKAQLIADRLDPVELQQRLEYYAHLACPVTDMFPSGWHWSIMQIEYSTDIIFKRPADLAPLYESLKMRAIQNVKVDDIATFLGRNGLSVNYEGEGGSRYNVLIEGTRLRHTLGHTSIKLYDKFSHILRIETTTNDVSFFKHHRKVEHRDGNSSMKDAPVKKTIHSLGIVRDLLNASNWRYISFLSRLLDDSSGRKELGKVTRKVMDAGGRSHRGINFFLKEDLDIVLAVLRPEHLISGVSTRLLRPLLPNWNGARISRAIRRLREHGLLKKIAKRFKYYTTEAGARVFLAAMRVRECEIIPALA